LYKLVIALLLLLTFSQAKEIKPSFKLKAVSFVSDFIVHQNRLYAATDQGIVDIFDLNTKKVIQQISLPPSITPAGETVREKIYSIDYLNGKLLIVAGGKHGYRNVWLYENFELKQLVDEKKKLLIKEARFIDDKNIIFGSFGSEMVLFDSEEGYRIYDIQLTQSALGDISLSADKQTLVMADESGEVRVMDVQTSKVLQVLDSENVDNVFHVAYAKETILTAGQDRRVGVYIKGRKPYHLKSNFLVFCVGLSPNASIGIYSSGTEHDLQVFNPQTKTKGPLLKGHKNLINQIKFINETSFFSSASDEYILFWELKQ